MARSRTVLLDLGVAMLVGCSGASNSNGSSSATVAEAKSALARNETPAVSAADEATLASDNEAFALSAYAALAKDPGEGNIFFSPYSISAALAMTYAGANGPTATEMATALHFSLPQERLQPAFDDVDLALNRAATPITGSTPFTLHVVNSMWGYTKQSFEEPFLDTIAVNYGTGVFLEDFVNDPTGSEKRINQWVSDQTDAKIQNLLDHDVTAATRLVLVDAIYFDADWVFPFGGSPVDGPFDTSTGTVSTPMMFNSNIEARATHTDAYDAIELPYQGTAVMDIVMPKAGTLGPFEATLTTSALETIVGGLATQPVTLTLPKFSYQASTISLKPLLQGLGMNLAFGEGADFTAIAHDAAGPLYISDVMQQAFLRVDEHGTEAAAATAVILDVDGSATVNPPNMLTITVDHPFFFTIRDTTTNTILFAGRITDPTK